MNCTECDTKCIKVEIDSTATRISYECPSCCNTFEKQRKPMPSQRPTTPVPPPPHPTAAQLRARLATLEAQKLETERLLKLVEEAGL